MQDKEKKIVVQSSVVVKKSPDFKPIQQKANASLSEEEAIERYTIGTHEEPEDDGESSQAQPDV